MHKRIENMKVWNYLCDEIAKDKSNNLKEDAFENRISMFFQSALYWSSINDELREQYPIEFAHKGTSRYCFAR